MNDCPKSDNCPVEFDDNACTVCELRKRIAHLESALESNRAICKKTVDKLEAENKELKAKQVDREKALKLLNELAIEVSSESLHTRAELRKMLEGK